MQKNIYFLRVLEDVPILKDESTTTNTVETSNGPVQNSGDTRNEDVQPESIYSSPRGVVAQVSLTSCEKHCFGRKNLPKLSGTLIKYVTKLPLTFVTFTPTDWVI
jgi:hypothetical protein